MNLPLTGGCLCGKVRYEIAAAPQQVYTCHCLDCQRLTGSAFSLAVLVAEEAFRLVAGEPRMMQSIADSGRPKVRFLCADCACWVFGASSADTGLRRVRAGTLDDTSWLRPTVHYWTRSRQPWIVLPEGDETFEAQPAA